MLTDVKYKFRIQRPANKDVKLLVFIRYTTFTHTPIGSETTKSYKAEVFTVDGWHEFAPYELLPDNLPEMEGWEE